MMLGLSVLEWIGCAAVLWALCGLFGWAYQMLRRARDGTEFSREDFLMVFPCLLLGPLLFFL